VVHGLKPYTGKIWKMVIVGSLLTTFEVSSIFEAAGDETKIGSSLRANHQFKLS